MNAAGDKVALPTLRRQAKHRWMSERKVSLTDGRDVWYGRWIEVPMMNGCYSLHYHDLKQLEEEGCVRINRHRHSRAGQLLIFVLRFAPRLYHIRRLNRTCLLDDCEPLAGDSGREGRMRRTAAIYWWLHERAVDGIYEGTVYDIPQADMSLPTAKSHFAKLERLELIRKINVGKGYEIPRYEIGDVK